MGIAVSLLTNDELRRSFNDLGFVTGSEALLPLLRQAHKAACVSDITVLLEGETGTGKGVLALAIHCLDQKRRDFPFVTMHCGSLSEALAESELFGHLKGAFTGAASQRKGLFQAAGGGTIFLDDVNDLTPHVQAKLLDVLQRGAVRAIGSDLETQVNVRIIAASNQLLKPLVLQNRFRADLYHRLNVARLWLPPLRDRRQDLTTLVLAFAFLHRDIYHPIEKLEPDLVSMLQSQSFPGNVRELENAVQAMLFSKPGGTSLGLADWCRRSVEAKTEEHPDLLGEAAAKVWCAISAQGLSYAEAIQQLERKVLEAALNDEGRTRRELAKRLRTSERTLYHKIRAYELGGQRSS
ncbi:MAG: sigma 54-interacting transcriptional regulator [Terriglobia bacterium]|jgi:transcriptional regulator with PAS, ATPase and Fis domain